MSVEAENEPDAAPREASDFAELNPANLVQIRRDAEAGDPSAMLELGRRLMIGRGVAPHPEEGVRLVSAAAERGDAEALNLLATLTSAGVWTQHSWPRALELLQRAAELGSSDAREQLTLLATDAIAIALAQTENPDSSLWRRLRESIDLEAFVRPPQPRPICKSPRVWRADGFARPAECARLIARSRGKLQPAKMYDRGQGAVRFNADRNNTDFFIDITNSSVALVLLRIRIGLLVGLPVPHMEPPQVLHYAPGQELRAHVDYLRDGTPGLADGLNSDRAATFLLYLNDEYEGGETHFIRPDLRYKGRPGDALFFANLRDGKPDRESLHSGTPVTSGEKWLFSQWIHDSPYVS